MHTTACLSAECLRKLKRRFYDNHNHYDLNNFHPFRIVAFLLDKTLYEKYLFGF